LTSNNFISRVILALLGKVWVNGKKSALARYLLWVNTTEEERKGKCREKKKPTIFPFPPPQSQVGGGKGKKREFILLSNHLWHLGDFPFRLSLANTVPKLGYPKLPTIIREEPY